MFIISYVLYDSTALTLDLLMTMTFLRFPIKKNNVTINGVALL